jgi:hypothetical protein
MYQKWCCDVYLVDEVGAFRKRQLFMTVLFDISRHYDPNAVHVERWEVSKCLSTSACGGPWKRGQLPDCAREECSLDGEDSTEREKRERLDSKEVVHCLFFKTPISRFVCLFV